MNHQRPKSRTLFLFIRHGRTLANEQKIIQGQTDSPLSLAGRQQAGTWGERLAGFSPDLILASPLNRSLHTVRILNRDLALPVFPDVRLAEQNWGKWTGMTLKQIRTRFPRELARQEASGWNFTPPFGESRKAVLKRAVSALFYAHDRFAGRNLLVITHQGVVKCLFYHLAKRKFLPDEPVLIQNGYAHQLVMGPGEKMTPAVNLVRLVP